MSDIACEPSNDGVVLVKFQGVQSQCTDASRGNEKPNTGTKDGPEKIIHP